MRRLCSVRSERLTGALKRRDGQGHTLMHWAAKAGDVEMLELLAGTRVLGTRVCFHVLYHSVRIYKGRSCVNIFSTALYINIYLTLIPSNLDPKRECGPNKPHS